MQEDYLIREIQRFSQVLKALLERIGRSKAGPGESQMRGIIAEAKKDERLRAFLDPESSDDLLDNVRDSDGFDRRNADMLAELLIELAERQPAQAGMYYQRALLLLEQAGDTVSLHRIGLLNRIPR